MKNILNRRTITILKRELREKLFSKAFLIMTVLMPVLMFGVIGLQAFLAEYEGDSNTIIEIISESDKITKSIAGRLLKENFQEETGYTVSFQTMIEQDFEIYLDEIKQDLISENISGIFFIPVSALEDKSIKYYSKTPNNFTITGKITHPVNRVLIEEFFTESDLTEQELKFARTGVDVKGMKVTEDKEITEQGYGNFIASLLVAFLLYLSLLIMGPLLMQSVIEEKSTRVIEVLLSSVSSSELMAGKILGSTITGLLQMTLWLSPLMLVGLTSLVPLPSEFSIEISIWQIVYLLFNFLLGLIIYLGLFATIGSIFENPQDAQSGVWPIMILIIVPFFICLSILKNPASPIVKITSMLPFSSIIVMPARMTAIDVSFWQLALSILINLATILAIFPIAGKIYKIGILHTGKKPKLSDIFGWLKTEN